MTRAQRSSEYRGTDRASRRELTRAIAAILPVVNAQGAGLMALETTVAEIRYWISQHDGHITRAAELAPQMAVQEERMRGVLAEVVDLRAWREPADEALRTLQAWNAAHEAKRPKTWWQRIKAAWRLVVNR